MDRRAHADRCYELPEEVGWMFEKEEDRDIDLMIEVCISIQTSDSESSALSDVLVLL